MDCLATIVEGDMIYNKINTYGVNYMRIIVCENYEEVSKKAAQMILSQVTLKPNSVLGLATGSTPIGMYEELS